MISITLDWKFFLVSSYGWKLEVDSELKPTKLRYSRSLLREKCVSKIRWLRLKILSMHHLDEEIKLTCPIRWRIYSIRIEITINTKQTAATAQVGVSSIVRSYTFWEAMIRVLFLWLMQNSEKVDNKRRRKRLLQKWWCGQATFTSFPATKSCSLRSIDFKFFSRNNNTYCQGTELLLFI